MATYNVEQLAKLLGFEETVAWARTAKPGDKKNVAGAYLTFLGGGKISIDGGGAPKDLKNASPLCKCGHGSAYHVDGGESCSADGCTCSDYRPAAAQNSGPAKKRAALERGSKKYGVEVRNSGNPRCSCGGNIEKIGDDEYECEDCGKLYESDDWGRGRLKAKD